MKNKKFAGWLLNELPEMEKDRLITKKTAGKIRSYYMEKMDRRNIALIIFAVIGAILIGLGIISLLAYNWAKLSRTARAAISMTPLVLSIIAAGALVIRNVASRAWKESVVAFWVISTGLAIALISQTYNTPGSFESYMLTVSVLCLPVIYIMSSTTASVFYLVGITVWAVDARIQGNTAVLFWGLLAAFVPFLINEIRKDKYSNGVLWLSWILCVCLSIALGVTLEKCVPGLWMVVYSSFFMVLYMSAKIIYGDATLFKQMAFHVFGYIGTAAMAYLLTMSWPWNDIGWGHYRSQAGFNQTAATADYILVLGLPVIAALLLRHCVRIKENILEEFGFVPLIVTLGFLFVSAGGNRDIAQNVLSVYVLYMSVRVIIRGINAGSLRVLNGGMLLFAVFIITKFFDTDIGFILRGVLFIVLGIGFLVGNVLLVRKKAGEK